MTTPAAGKGVELANAWITIIPDSSKIAPSISGAIKSIDGVKAGESLGDRLSGGLKKSLKVGAAAAGTAIAGTLGASFTKGFSRLNNIDQANAKLSGLGHDAQTVGKIMDNALAAVKGTAFGLGEAATTAASAVAAGVKPGRDLERTLTLMGDAATIAGTGIGDMGYIINKVATADMMQMDVANQIMDAGIPILQLVGEEMGVTAQEARALASEGKVSFEIFQSALEEGMGGAAQRSGDTFAGAFANMGAAMGRFGAALLEPAFQTAPQLFGAIGDSFDDLSGRLSPVIEQFGQWLTPKMEYLAQNIAPWTEQALNGIEQVVKRLAPVVEQLWPSIQSLGESFFTIGQNISAATWLALTNTLNALAPILESVIVPMLERIAEFAENNPGKIEKLVYAFLGFKAVSTVAGPVSKFASILGNVGGAVKFLTTSFKGGNFASGLVSVMAGFKSSNPIIAAMGKGVALFTKLLAGVSRFVGPLINVLGTVIRFVNPWVAAFTLITGALTLFFTKTETGQRLMQVFGEKIKAVWDTVSVAILAAWENFIRPTLETLGRFISQVLGGTLAVVVGLAIGTWNMFAALFKGVWDTILSPVLGFIGDKFLWLWDNAIRPAIDWIVAKWNWLGEMLSVAWAWIKTNVIDTFAAAVAWFWESVIQPVLGWIVDRWNWLKDALGIVWQWIKVNVIDLFVAALTALWNNVVNPILNFIGDKWDWLKDKMSLAWNWVKTNVLDPMGQNLETVKGWFRTAVDAMGNAWDELKQKTKEPIQWVVDKVYNEGILPAWNKVAGLVDLKPLEPVTLKFASGGVLPGYTPGRDPYTFVEPNTGMSIGLSGGEAILRPEATRALGAEAINSINHAARTGGQRAVTNLMGHYGHTGKFAKGGFVHLGNFADGGYIHGGGAGRLSEVTKSHAKFISRFFPGIFTLTSAERYTDSGYHSKMKATDWSNGGDAGTPEMKQLAGAIAKNFPNTAQLIHWPLAGWENILNGGPFDYGPGTNAEHRNHVHWATENPIRFDGDDIVLDDAPGGGTFEPIINGVKKLWDAIINRIPIYAGGTGGEFGELPGAWLKVVAGKAWEFIKSSANAVENLFKGGSGSGAERWRDLASKALARMGYGDEYLDAMVRQIQIESGGDPSAINNWDSNAQAGIPSGGLLQVIEPTYRDVRARYPEAFEGLPDDRFHPLTNLVAGIGAVKRDWGGPGGRWPTTGGYATGGIVKLFDQGGWLNHGEQAVNKSGKPEPVFNATQWAVLRRMIDEVSKLHPALKDMTTKVVPAIEGMADGLSKLISPNSEEGVTARGVAERLNGVGILPLGGLVSSLLDGEKKLLAVRSEQDARAKAIAEAEAKLAEAKKALTEAENASVEQSKQNNGELADAELDLAKAREESSKAQADGAKQIAKAESDNVEAATRAAEAREESAEKSVKATDKVSRAEEDLARTRADVDEKAQADAKQYADNLAKARDDVKAAEDELAKARQDSVDALDMSLYSFLPQISQAAGAASTQLASLAGSTGIPLLGQAAGMLGQLAAAAGPAGVTVGTVVAGLEAVFKVAEEISKIVGAVLQTRAEAYKGIASMMGAVREFTQMAAKARETVVGLVLDQAMAQIQLAAAQRNVNMVRMDGVRAQMQGAIELAEAERAFEESRRNDLNARLMTYDDLSIAYDRMRTGVVGVSSDIDGLLSGMEEWSDETHASYSRLMAAQVAQQLLEEEAKKANLEATFKATLAALDLRDVSRDLGTAVEKLAVVSGEQFGFTTVEATIGQEYAKLAAEKAEIIAKSAEAGTWLNPVNTIGSLFGVGYYAEADRRIKQIDKEMADLAARPDFKEFDKGSKREIDRIISSAGAMGFFGGGDQVSEMIRNSFLGDAARSLERVKFENELIDRRAEEDKLRDSVERSLAEIDQAKKIYPIDNRIEALKQEKGAHETWAKFYETPEENSNVRKLYADYANLQMDHAQQINKSGSKIILNGNNFEFDQVYEMLKALGHDVDTLKNPSKTGGEVIKSRMRG